MPRQTRQLRPRKVNALLKERHIDQEEIATRTFVSKLGTLERIDRMIMQSEGRRNLVLREIERRRTTLPIACTKRQRR